LHLLPSYVNESPTSSEKIINLYSEFTIFLFSIESNLKTGNSTFFKVIPGILILFKSINFHLSFDGTLIAYVESKKLHNDKG
jgi:hypothetical protein